MRKKQKDYIKKVKTFTKPAPLETLAASVIVLTLAIAFDFTRCYSLSDILYSSTSFTQVLLAAAGTAIAVDFIPAVAGYFMPFKHKTTRIIVFLMLTVVALFFFAGFIMQSIYAVDIFFPTVSQSDESFDVVASLMGTASAEPADAGVNPTLKLISQVLSASSLVATSVLTFAVSSARSRYTAIHKLEVNEALYEYEKGETESFENSLRTLDNESLAQIKLDAAKHQLALDFGLMVETVRRSMCAKAENTEVEALIADICNQITQLGYQKIVVENLALGAGGTPNPRSAFAEDKTRRYTSDTTPFGEGSGTGKTAVYNSEDNVNVGGVQISESDESEITIDGDPSVVPDSKD